GCGPGATPETVPEAVATARALVRPHVARNAALTAPGAGGSTQGAAVSPRPPPGGLWHPASHRPPYLGRADPPDRAQSLADDSPPVPGALGRLATRVTAGPRGSGDPHPRRERLR